jgi:hypothetical protein
MNNSNTELSTKKVVEQVQYIIDERKSAPNGCILDDSGNFIKLINVKETELSKDGLVTDLVRDCAVIADELQALKHSLKTKIANYVDSMFKEYDKKLGGKKGNITLFSYDKKLKVERSLQDRETTNENIIFAKALVDDCLKKWSKGANRNLQVVVQRYFKTDGKGSYNVQLLKSLIKHPMPNADADWEKAMLELGKSIEFDSTATYYRAYYRAEDGTYNNIPLDIANIR